MRVNKKWTALLFALCALLWVAPVMTVYAEEESPTDYEVRVCGIDVTSDNAADVWGDGTVCYDVATNTLTLENANLATYSEGIYSWKKGKGITIELKGSNTITADDNGMPYCGIGSRGDVTIKGSGSLTVTNLPVGIDTDFSSSYLGTYEVYGITIEDGATVILNCTETEGYTEARALSVKLDLSGYTDVVIMAGFTADSAYEVTDPENSAYDTYKYVSISPKLAEPEVVDLQMRWEGTSVKWHADTPVYPTGDSASLTVNFELYRKKYTNISKELVAEVPNEQSLANGLFSGEVDFAKYMTEAGRYWVEVSVSMDDKKYTFTGYDISEENIFSGYQTIERIDIETVDEAVEVGKTPVFTGTVAEADRGKYRIYLEQWGGSDGKVITSQEYFNNLCPEDERITVFEEGVTYTYSVWLKVEEGYAISENADVYLNGHGTWGSEKVSHDSPGEAPEGCSFDLSLNKLYEAKCVLANLTVNDIEVTTANMNDILGDADGDGATVYYNPETKTLTLDGASLTSKGFSAIWTAEKDITIELKGENKIIGEGDAECAIYTHNSLTVTGDGSLTTKGTGFGIYGNSSIAIEGGATVNITVDFPNDMAPQPYSAVRALGGLTVDGATFTAQNTGTSGEWFGALGISTSLTAKNGAKVDILSKTFHGVESSVIVSGKGTVVTIVSESSEHYGIYTGREDFTEEWGGDLPEFSVSDGAVLTAIGGKGAMRWKPDLTGYTDPYIVAGADEAGAVEVTDPDGTDYNLDGYVHISGERPQEEIRVDEWLKSGNRWWYRHTDGSYTKSGWEKIDGKWYLFDKDGWMLTGWQQVGGKWYLLNSSGVMLTGWQQVGGKWYLLNSSGVMLTGWQQVGGKWYLLNGSGVMLTGWQQAGGKWYLFDKDGVMLTGWQQVGGKWYLFDKDGAMLTGWQQVGGKWYLLDNSGAMLTGWQKSGGKWYLLDNSGAMRTGWQQVGGKWYLLNSSGVMRTGWQQVGGKWYLFDKNGVMLTGWQKSGGKWYLFDNSGAMLTGWQQAGGKWYLLDNSGAMLTGWQQVGGKWYYMYSSGAMAVNTWIGNSYVDGSGVWIVGKTK